MLKTIVSNATLSTNNEVSTKKDYRYIKYVKPEMLSHANVANPYSKKTGVFVCLGSESLRNFNQLYRFANISSQEDQDLYEVYAEGANLEKIKGKGAKKHNQKISDSNDALNMLLEQGFYTIINFSAKPNNIFGSGTATKYPRGINYSDIKTVFGKKKIKAVKGTVYTNYTTETFNACQGLITNVSGKIALVNASNFQSFKETTKSFMSDNQEMFDNIKKTEASIIDISVSEDPDYSVIDFKSLSSDKTTTAKAMMDIVMQFPIATYAVGGNVMLFA